MVQKELGNIRLDKEVIRQDRKTCVRFENCGIGKEAIYLGNYFFSCCKVIPLNCIIRIYKRVAMSKGGFTGKGVFGSIPYVVVLLNDGTEAFTSFKNEINVDKFIDYVKDKFPNIKTISAKQEELLAKAKAEREARRKKDLSDIAKDSIKKLNEVKEYLLKYKDEERTLSVAAKEKRASMLSKNVYIYFVWIMLVIGIITTGYGVYAIINKFGNSMYITIFGFAIIFFFSSVGVLPTQRYNKKVINDTYDAALKKVVEIANAYSENLPIPKKYMHYATINRLINVIEEGRAETIKEAYEVFVSDLKKMNKDVSLYPDEYEEVMAVKPIFLVENYKED